MSKILIVFVLFSIYTISCKPLYNLQNMLHSAVDELSPKHSIERRFVDTDLEARWTDSDFEKLRTKRSEEDCEKLELCRLHARSTRNFVAAFELYFVNRENAHLWDHRARSLRECGRRYRCSKK
ncbi:hypothetical protein ACJJTC_005365 [Scirpophaga incertulas]